jgi:hypothetical protein
MVFSRIYEYASKKASNDLIKLWKSKGLKELGKGMSRRVFYDGERVYKVAIDDKEGVVCNKLEFDICKRYSKFDFIMRVYDHAEDWLWISCDYCPGIKEQDFESYGIPWRRLRSTIMQLSENNPVEPDTPLLKKICTFARSMKKEKVDILDWTNPENWGVRDGQLVLVDLAYNDEIAEIRFPTYKVGQMVQYKNFSGEKVVGCVLNNDDYTIRTDVDGTIEKSSIVKATEIIPELETVINDYWKEMRFGKMKNLQKYDDKMTEFEEDFKKYKTI